MALFRSLTTEALAYILRRQRTDDFEGVQSRFFLRPMDNRETQLYFSRREAAANSRRDPVDRQAANVSDIDHETLRGCLTKATAIYKDDDTVEGPEDIGTLVDRLTWSEMQELLTAVTNRSVLEEGEKNF